MFGWAAGFAMLLLVSAAVGGGFGGVSAGAAFLLFLAFPFLFITALIAVALREPPSPERRAEAERLARVAHRLPAQAAPRAGRQRVDRSMPAPRRRAEEVGARH